MGRGWVKSGRCGQSGLMNGDDADMGDYLIVMFWRLSLFVGMMGGRRSLVKL